MIVSIENLNAGINWWQQEMPRWGPVNMNREYREIYDQRDGGARSNGGRPLSTGCGLGGRYARPYRRTVREKSERGALSD
jgi:hypothetical protein